MSTRTIRSYQHRALADLARTFEQHGAAHGTRFTCNAVAVVLGRRVSQDYARVFQFDNASLWAGIRNEIYLWSRSGRTQTKWRVLMLCFAAAMVATGDLQ